MSNFEFHQTKLKGPILIKPKKFIDNRGYFLETFQKENFEEAGVKDEFVQDNSSFSRAGVMRGLHFQYKPYEISKLIRCNSGAIFDVIVDMRVNSPDFGKYESFELNDANAHILYVPKGFAHGFYALTDAVISYKTSGYYAPEYDGGIRYNDPELGIIWPDKPKVISSKDEELPFLQEIKHKL